MKKTVLLIVSQIVLLVAAIGGTWFFLGNAGDTGQAPAVKAAPTAAEPIYITMDPPFVVNMTDGRAVRFLQVQIDLMTRKDSVVKKLEKYDPRIRNDLIMLFSNVTREDIQSREGRELLQQSALAAVNQVLQDETGSAGVEAVYFTKFVMQ